MPNDIDLWPADIIKPPVASPITILKAQAAKLGAKTSHLVEAGVRTVMDGTWFNHIFELVVPMLDDYHYDLFKVAHAADAPYPMTIYAYGIPQQIIANDEAAFVSKISEILKSEKTKKTIANFMALYQPEVASPKG